MPTKVEKLNSHRIRAMNTTPNRPRWWAMDAWSRSISSSPATFSAGVTRMMKAVQLQMTMVSINTPSACKRPVLAGWEVSPAAAAQGAEPEPASLENSPRFTPFMTTAPKPPAAAWRRPNASSKMRRNTSGRTVIFIPMRMRVMTK